MPRAPDQSDPLDRQEPDPIEPGAPFDAQQWAMHGLLSAYLEPDDGRHERRVAAILERIRGESGPATAAPNARRSQPRITRGQFRWVARSGVAASLALAVIAWLLASRAVERRAFAALIEPAVAQAMSTNSVLDDEATLCKLNVPGLGDVGASRDGQEEPIGALGRYLASVDCWQLAAREEGLERLRQERDRWLEAVTASAAEHGSDPDVDLQSIVPATELMHAWWEYARELRALTRWDEARAEIDAAIDYCNGNNSAGMRWKGLYESSLNYLAQTLEWMGDYDGAWDAHQQSIASRAEGGVDEFWVADPNPCAYAGNLVSPFLDLSWLAVLRADGRDGLPEARAWHHRAGIPLRVRFGSVLEANRIPFPIVRGRRIDRDPRAASADELISELLALYRAQPEVFRKPRASAYSDTEQDEFRARFGGCQPDRRPVGWLRVWLFNEVRLRRVAGDYDGAAAVLGELATVPANPFAADQRRLDFYEPLENARVAILRGEYADALPHLDRAEANSGRLDCPFEPKLSHPPVGALPLAEVDLLRGVARRGAHGPGHRGAPLAANLDNLASAMPAEARNRTSAWLKVCARHAPGADGDQTEVEHVCPLKKEPADFGAWPWSQRCSGASCWEAWQCFPCPPAHAPRGLED
ncbi:MAG: hypothetical protein HZB38_12325 [Planctomycetes bacterium]|nr:hypothetical protein [Planctomycetota bacterium]